MAGITLDQANQQLQAWLAASAAAAQAQSYEIGGRKLTRADAGEIGRQITYWQGMVNKLSRRGGLSFAVGAPR